jgi:hypothetical protein
MQPEGSFLYPQDPTNSEALQQAGFYAQEFIRNTC